MINLKDYEHLIKIYGIQLGIEPEDLRDEFPHFEYDHYDDLEFDLQQRLANK